MLDVLGELVAKSMLVVVRTDQGRTRYELLETLRQYALEQLDAAEAESARRRHAAYFAELAAALGQDLKAESESRGPPRKSCSRSTTCAAAMAWSLDHR